MACPCGSKLEYSDCCQPLHEGKDYAKTAEQLMRSRYSAFAKKQEQYILDTWYPSMRNDELNLKKDPTWWTGLEIVDTAGGLEADSKGEVEFIASYTVRKKEFKLHERSSFVQEDGHWLYVDGQLSP